MKWNWGGLFGDLIKSSPLPPTMGYVLVVSFIGINYIADPAMVFPLVHSDPGYFLLASVIFLWSYMTGGLCIWETLG